MQGIDTAGAPRTESIDTAIEVPEGGGAFFDIDISFDDLDFVEPIVEPASLPIGFLPPDGEPIRGCSAPTSAVVPIDRVRITVLDAHGGPLDPPVRLDDGRALDGSALPCPPAILRTEPLRWGGYLARVEALEAGGAVCFTTDAALPPRSPRIPDPHGPCGRPPAPGVPGRTVSDSVLIEEASGFRPRPSAVRGRSHPPGGGITQRKPISSVRASSCWAKRRTGSTDSASWLSNEPPRITRRGEPAGPVPSRS